jgi:hypothetical protein
VSLSRHENTEFIFIAPDFAAEIQRCRPDSKVLGPNAEILRRPSDGSG